MTDTPLIKPIDPHAATTPTPVHTPPAKAQVPETKVATEKEKLLKEIQETLAKYKGLESDIPLNSNYWSLVNRFRGL